MPAFRLESNLVELALFDIVVQDSPHKPNFAQHIALHWDSYVKLGPDVGSVVKILHMGPPIETSDKLVVNSVGMANLSAAERKQVETWVKRNVDDADPPWMDVARYEQYVIRPHVSWWVNENKKFQRNRRFSCVGFVLMAYQEGCGLVLIDTESRPLIGAESVKEAYRHLFPEHDFDTLRKKLSPRYKWGVDGDGPWPVVLPGHVLHSLSRSSDEIREGPYQPKAGDEYF